MRESNNEIIFEALMENELELSKSVTSAVAEYDDGNYTAKEAMEVIKKATFGYLSNRVIYQAVFEHFENDEE